MTVKEYRSALLRARLRERKALLSDLKAIEVKHERDAFDQSGDPPPYSCRSGCGRCAVDRFIRARE